jgi:tetratricopeptide (TPR) repeat protein
MQNTGSKNSDAMQEIARLVAGGHLSESIAALHKIIEKNPREYNALLGLSHLSDATGEMQSAIEYAIRAIAVLPNRFEAHCQLGQLYKKLRQFDRALPCFHKATQLMPGSSQAWHNLGLLCMENGRMAEAIEHLRKAVSLDGRFAVGHYNLANALKRHGRLTASVTHYKKALALKRDFVEAKNNLGTTYLDLGDLDAAEGCFREVLEESPGSPNAISGLARICDYRREFDTAIELLGPYALREVNHVGLAVTYADMARSTGKTDQAMRWLEKIVADSKIPEVEKARAYFTLGKLEDRAGDFDAAFLHYKRANQIRRTSYDINATSQYFEHIKRSFSRSNIEKLGAATSRDSRPVFIVGMPRSGTSLVEQILAGSPDVYAAGETEDIDLLILRAAQKRCGGEEGPSSVANISKEEIEALSTRYVQTLDARCGARLHLDKMPHNFTQLGWINLIAPGARIIHCARNPVDTCLSCYFQDFAGFHPYSNDLTDLAQYYCLYINLMTHWADVLRLPIKHVCYEQLIAQPEAVSKGLFAFCGVEWQSVYLNIQQRNRVVSTLSYDQVRRPIYSASVNRWNNYVRHLEPLLNEFSRRNREGFSWERWCKGGPVGDVVESLG